MVEISAIHASGAENHVPDLWVLLFLPPTVTPQAWGCVEWGMMLTMKEPEDG